MPALLSTDFRSFLMLFVMVAALSAASPAEADDGVHPNVVLIMTDDQGYGDFSITGNPYLQTPHIDRLGAEGIQFERFYVNSFCAPTRAALLTGRYPLRCGVWGVTHNKEAMRPSEVTLAEALGSNGYRTGCFGKWHNGEQYPYTPTGQGFDEFFGFHNGHFNNYFDAELIHGSDRVPTTGYITDVITDEALNFIDAENDSPFFCYIAYNAPHSPFQVPDSYFDRFDEQDLEELDETVSAFYGMCENIDDNVGRVMAKLEEQGLIDNTLVVFLTDNGGTAGVRVYNAGMRGGKTSVHEGGCRVPLFVYWPAKLGEPRVIPQIASHIDLFPTILELCGVEQPEGPPLDGMSLAPLLDDEAQMWPERMLFTHNPISQENRYPGAVRTQQYRLVCEIPSPQGGSRAQNNDENASNWQLYDMLVDPGESNNIAADHPDVVSVLSVAYENWMDDIRSVPLERFPIPISHAEENPVRLNAPQAFSNGSLTYACGPGWAQDWLTNWSDADSRVWFEIDVVRAGTYLVELNYACQADDAGTLIRVSVGDEAFDCVLSAAEAPRIPLPHRDEQGLDRYVNREWGALPLGTLTLPAGPATLTIERLDAERGSFLEIKSIDLQLVIE